MGRSAVGIEDGEHVCQDKDHDSLQPVGSIIIMERDISKGIRHRDESEARRSNIETSDSVGDGVIDAVRSSEEDCIVEGAERDDLILPCRNNC